MNIEKTKNMMGSYDFCLTKKDKTLKIIFAGNLDLYFMLSNGKMLPYKQNVSLFFDIDKEDNEIFELFDSLYKDVISGNVFGKDALFETYYDPKKYTESFEYSLLVDENFNINWVSDDGPLELEDSLTISKIDDDKYRLIFNRNDKPLDFGFKSSNYINVRFCNSGSRYNPFNCVFMRMFNRLQEIDNEHIQDLSNIPVYIRERKKQS